jgi:N-acetylmuramoyl-L-alanine amidase
MNIKFLKLSFYVVLITAVTLSCVQNPYKTTNKIYNKQAKLYSKLLRKTGLEDSIGVKSNANWVGTTNFNMRKPNYVIIHHTAQNSCDQTLKFFTLARTQVSAHYLICKDGTVHHMLNDYLRAWHAGVSKWGNNTDINSSSIGIELDNTGFESFSASQIESLEKLLAHLKKAYSIPKANFIGHADIAPTRKNDPNISFDWQRLSAKGYGLWYADTLKTQVPIDFNSVFALKMIGYNLADTTAVISTFKRKFIKDETNKTLTNSDLKVLYEVWKEAMK